jgi:hypothetical protein
MCCPTASCAFAISAFWPTALKSKPSPAAASFYTSHPPSANSRRIYSPPPARTRRHRPVTMPSMQTGNYGRHPTVVACPFPDILDTAARSTPLMEQVMRKASPLQLLSSNPSKTLLNECGPWYRLAAVGLLFSPSEKPSVTLSLPGSTAVHAQLQPTLSQSPAFPNSFPLYNPHRKR